MSEATSKLPHSRIQLLVKLVFVVVAIFVARLFYMQIIEHEKYVSLAVKEQVKSLVIHAKRGEIYAMDGTTPVKMVLNEGVFTVFVDPVDVDQPNEIVKAIHSVAGGEAVEGIEELVRAKPSRYKIVAKNISNKQASILKSKNLRGLGFQPTTRRVYPEGKLAAQTLGFVNAEEKGQYGIEEGLDGELRGKDGILKSVTDVRNVPLSIGGQNTRIPSEDGKNVVLTLDRNIQSYTEKALASQLRKIGASAGSVLVMDPNNGHVLAMANSPTYNPEKFTTVKNPAAFNNATVTSPYEPASVMKTYSMAMAVDKGIMTPQTTYVNNDYIKVDDRTIENAFKGIRGTISMQTALNNSLNTATVTLLERLGGGSRITYDARKTMYNYYHDKFGLGERTGIEVAGEAKGQVISPDEVEGNAVRYANMTFGQGLEVTMMQVSAGFCSIINGGSYYKPTIVGGYVDANDVFKKKANPSSEQKTISASTSRTMRKMLYDARRTTSPGIDKKGYEVGGKTGTAQTIVNGKYNSGQTVATYLGYGGDSKPRYVIMVQVSGPGKNYEGGIHARPIFTDISNWMIDYMKLEPKG
ncbi:MAG TPA: penicillin-binding protein 2 [Candidatus Saccharimonadales bacterium]